MKPSANFLEHTNLTVRDPKALAQKLCTIFDWQIRWQGDAINEGFTVHVGSASSYLALYTPKRLIESNSRSDAHLNNLNHIGVVVESLDEIQAKLNELGLETFSHRDYEPGQRFYVLVDDDLELEVISYAA